MPSPGLTPLTFHILLSLVDQDRHGYGIVKEIEERAGAATAPSTGALYLALQRLEQERWVEESPVRPSPEHDDARRRYYRLTPAGRSAARAEAQRLASLVGMALDKRLVASAARERLLKAGSGRAR